MVVSFSLTVCVYMYIMNFLISWGNLRGIRICVYVFLLYFKYATTENCC